MLKRKAYNNGKNCTELSGNNGTTWVTNSIMKISLTPLVPCISESNFK